ncbi:NAD-dependent succinate-semialdehyde dehydrogenase [Xanthobacter tagetidis]|uniref:NAD-dependent succinate-semialdehyde dehydrogenase n=1 Tax=Xanthobacter tagetidis TaxID=60216 RepID=A0A3L7ALK9_9HYPH|nr:NAD-dependent succinate-semialdehyde dehydrogenase [Xanthobacter tagetidis]MBB6309061.1 succinate-semialdehyde dehydrogenase/glutarate-semialdehyde dehydrogenase [Xanthobacter tagetidis]RLP80448.1 NAD-dependent succinate-semialdehyde dehydrogenase [Xanthobacter tagetidis]
MYRDVLLHIGGEWRGARDGRTFDIVNPATEDAIGTCAFAGTADLDDALAAAAQGFAAWRRQSAHARAGVLMKAAELLRARAEDVAQLMVLEQGKPLAEARIEVQLSADVIQWFAGEAARIYGRVVPARADHVRQLSLREPVGVVAAFTPWNFPVSQATRKSAAALAAGCAVILKGPEEAPACCAELVRAFADAGLPAGALNLVYGHPPDISGYLVPHPQVRKISFTGSTVVGKQLAALAGAHMKRATMELGGHAPAIVCADADLDTAVRVLAAGKFRNAGQVCIAPTRFLVEQSVYQPFLERFVAAAEAQRLGSGLDPDTTMGPLANPRRLQAMEAFMEDARDKGGRVVTGGERRGNRGWFYAPTVVSDLPPDARLLNEEPFGPVALIAPFETLDAVIAEANRLPFGLAAYAYTRSQRSASRLGGEIESGMVSINHHGLGLPETPFGGVKDSGYGSEGGAEGIEPYLNVKFVSQLDA